LWKGIRGKKVVLFEKGKKTKGGNPGLKQKKREEKGFFHLGGWVTSKSQGLLGKTELRGSVHYGKTILTHKTQGPNQGAASGKAKRKSETKRMSNSEKKKGLVGWGILCISLDPERSAKKQRGGKRETNTNNKTRTSHGRGSSKPTTITENKKRGQRTVKRKNSPPTKRRQDTYARGLRGQRGRRKRRKKSKETNQGLWIFPA